MQVLKDIKLLLDYLSSFVGPHRGRDSDRMLPWMLQRCIHTLLLLSSKTASNCKRAPLAFV